MRRPRKRGKHVEDPISGNCLDRISSLPDKLLGHVLSFLPTRLAVITSILSTRWRYLFTLTTCLSFDDQISYVDQEPNEIIEATRCFNEFVDKVVKLHQISPIKKFSLVCHGTYDKSDLNRWLTNALQKGVQELSYERYGSIDRVSDHDSLFMCETLVSLKMKDPGYNTIKFPQSARLPKLKILHLDWILFFDFNSMEKLFSGCQLLEELTLKCCGCHTDGHAFHRTEILKVLTVKSCNFTWGTFEIDAPNLVYLRYSSSTGVRIFPSWKSSCSFDKAKLHLDYNYDKDSVKYDRELLKAAAYKVTKLRFMNNSVQDLVTLDDDEQMPDFLSLSSLHLGDICCNAWKYVTSLLDKSPQLKTVVFKSGIPCWCMSPYECSKFCYCNSLRSPSDIPDIPLDPFSCHVDEIRVYNFCEHKVPLLLIGHLLKNATVLRNLTVCTDFDDSDSKEELKICKQLSMLPRVSKDCCVRMN